MPSPRVFWIRRITALAVLLGVAGLAVVLLRAGGGSSAAADSARTVSIEWVGDMTLGSRYGVPPDHGIHMFDGVRRRLQSADLTTGNLEGTLSVGGRSKCASSGGNCFAFQAPPGNAVALAKAGFDLVNVANNHAFDFGASGQHQTIRALRRRHVAESGKPGQITVLRRNGLRVAFVGFAPYPWAAPLLDIRAAQALVRRAARRADVVVAMIHAGAEGSDRTHTPHGTEHAFGENRGNPRAFAHAVVRAGADLVVGSGPHVLRGVECYRGRLIAYSLGNFAGYNNFSRGGVLSLSAILSARVDARGRLLSASVVPLRLTGPGLPHADRSHGATHLMAALSREDFPHSPCRLGRNGGVRVGR